MKLQQALAMFLVQLDANGRSSHTVRQYSRHVRALDRWLHESGKNPDVANITHQVIAEFLVSPAAKCRPDGNSKMPTSANALRTSLRCFFAYLFECGAIPSNPARLIKRAMCSPPPPRALSHAERDRLVAALEGATTVQDQRDRTLFVILVETGMRIGSALGVRVEDVDLGERRLWVTTAKAGRSYEANLTEKATEMLALAIGGRKAGLVFAGIGVRHAQRRFRTWTDRAGVRADVSLHALRHTFARAVYAERKDILAVQRALGHTSVVSTAIYLRPLGVLNPCSSC